jgi:hypothetical protein
MINRKDFLRYAILAGAYPAVELGAHAQTPSKFKTTEPHKITLANNDFRLSISAGTGLKCHLVHILSGTVLADGDYSYSFGEPSFSTISKEMSSVEFSGATKEGIHVEHRFTVDPAFPWIEEEIKVRNTKSHPVRLPFRCGFVLPAGPDTFKGFVFSAVPYRREPRASRGHYEDYTIDQILYRPRRSKLREDPPRSQAVWPRLYEDYASEGWAFTDGTQGFLITKHNEAAREYALLDRVPLEGDLIGFRWAGAGASAGDPEGYCEVDAGATHDFGTTRLTSFTGDILQGFNTFRAEMESKGHGVPKGFDPPVHWNELYDNKLWWLGEPAYLEAANREKYYRLEDMKVEAAKAKAIGCEALYLDPGWDTPQSSKRWDETRLGKLTDFVSLLKSDYGLRLSLHTPLTNWVDSHCDVIPGTDRLGPDGKIIPYSPCGASSQYVEETSRRLQTLAQSGVVFFMFDGTWFNGECWDPKHGHSVPSTISEHVDATNRLARLVHEKYPDVLIEMHDQVVGGADVRYVPTYYGHGKDGHFTDAPGGKGFDSVWAFELMWRPMDDLLAGRSIALYYYNLAYSLPLYVHIDLRTDNAQGLVFWWNASTCRHLGFGGTATDAAVRSAHEAAMKTYRRLKPFFSAGIFYGIDELTHVHRHPDHNAAVVNCFNLEAGPVEKDISFNPQQFGLNPARRYEIRGSHFSLERNRVANVTIPGRGHVLLEVIES